MAWLHRPHWIPNNSSLPVEPDLPKRHLAVPSVWSITDLHVLASLFLFSELCMCETLSWTARASEMGIFFYMLGKTSAQSWKFFEVTQMVCAGDMHQNTRLLERSKMFGWGDNKRLSRFLKYRQWIASCAADNLNLFCLSFPPKLLLIGNDNNMVLN